MENTASLPAGEELQGQGVTTYAPPLLWSTAERLAQAAGRTARRVFAFDLAFVGLSSLALWALSGVTDAPGLHNASLALLIVLTLGAFAAASLYATVQRPNPAALWEARRLATATAGALLVWALASTLVFDELIDRPLAGLLLAWMALVVPTTLLARRLVRRRALEAHPERILIVGAGTTGQALARRILGGSRGQMTVVGFFDDDPLPLDPALEGVPVFEETIHLTQAIELTGATRIIIAFSRRPATDLLETLRNSRFGAIPISVVPRYFEITPAHATLSEIDGVPLVELHSARLSRGAQLTKRALDVTLAGFGLLVLSPLLLAVAAAVKVTSPGPVFFGQMRTGHNGRAFRMWKFRTMIKDAEAWRMELAHLNDMAESGPLFKIRHDPRVTPVGRFLRRFSIDELPQLFNVINGTMSLVGPRPFVCHEADLMDGWATRRLDLVPGITGLWQVRGRNDVPYEEMIRLDYMYVTNWSVWWDLKLLLETVPQVLTGRGAS